MSNRSLRQTFYGTTAWKTARADFLKSHPSCQDCKRRGIRTAATVVDHIEPHRGDQRLFWSRRNWQAATWMACPSTRITRGQQRDTDALQEARPRPPINCLGLNCPRPSPMFRVCKSESR